MFLSDILRIFSIPLKEEQAWALCYCSARFLSQLVENGAKTVLVSEGNLDISETGIVSINSECENSHDNGEGELIEALGLLLVKSLNYGLDPDHPLSISENLDNLLLHMTSTLSHDEGVASCSTVSFEDLISACSVRISSDPAKCSSHYQSVCSSMVAEAKELTSFLDIVGHSSDQNDDNAIMHGDVAKIWLSVMSELRHGVKLKHLEPVKREPRVFELSPYEVLLSDIRSQRYQLNQVMVNGEIPRSVRKSAESIILDYIKSRPRLKVAPKGKKCNLSILNSHY